MGIILVKGCCGEPDEPSDTASTISRFNPILKSQAIKWESPKVATWLELLGLVEYRDSFLKHGVNGYTLLHLDEEQITRGLEITNDMHKYSLIRGIEDLKRKRIDYDSWEWTAVGVQEWLRDRGLDMLIESFTENAVHGGVLFHMSREDFARKLHVGQNSSPIIIDSLITAIQHAKVVGRAGACTERVADWGPSEVFEWLNSLHLPHLDAKFRHHAIHGTILLTLDQNRLQNDMGLSEIQALVVGRAIKRLRKKEKRPRNIFRRGFSEDVSDVDSSYYTSASQGTQMIDFDDQYSDFDGVYDIPGHPYNHHHRSHSVPLQEIIHNEPNHRRAQTTYLNTVIEYDENRPLRANIAPVNTRFASNSRQFQAKVHTSDYFDRFASSPTRNTQDDGLSDTGNSMPLSPSEFMRQGGGTNR